jgi:hypothetical protein
MRHAPALEAVRIDLWAYCGITEMLERFCRIITIMLTRLHNGLTDTGLSYNSICNVRYKRDDCALTGPAANLTGRQGQPRRAGLRPAGAGVSGIHGEAGRWQGRPSRGKFYIFQLGGCTA